MRVYFCREVAQSARALVGKHELKKRRYLGPTSMDHELSLIMANVARVRPGSFVIDPFVGTGSVLVACAQFGAVCMGTDIDFRILKGKGEKTTMSNFAQYGLPMPELVRSDNALYHRHWRTLRSGVFDAIVCDPPYGIRAGARTSGAREGVKVMRIAEEERLERIPRTRPYPVADVMFDLMDMSARCLVEGGRLVYILPTTYDFDADAHLPRHPCLETLFSCEQPLTTKLARRLVVARKVRAYEPEKREEYRQRCHIPVEEQAALPYNDLKAKMKRDSRPLRALTKEEMRVPASKRRRAAGRDGA